MDGAQQLYDHLAGGKTTVCQAWLVRRRDGWTRGFTDHDVDLAFGGMVFSANSGMTARALQQTTGLSVDNTEAVGALSDASVTEADLLAGLFDGAEVRAWVVNWADPEARVEVFRGTFGEVARSGGAFRAELRGLTEAMNLPVGRVFQRDCCAVLGDAKCRFNLAQPGYAAEVSVIRHDAGGILRVALFDGFAPHWFERGRCTVISGDATGLSAMIKFDRTTADGREIVLWQDFLRTLAPGDLIQLEAGCDRSPKTCQDKFNNFINFHGFPHLPSEDWLAAYPSRKRSE